MTLRARFAWVACVASLITACGPTEQDLSIRQWTEGMAFRIYSDPLPPAAREKIRFRVVVRDSKTGQPVEKGEGRMFASTREGQSTWDSLEEGPELGTYYANLNFVIAGEWAMALQFRRDSTRKLERMDWMQQVFPERPDIPSKP